MKLLVPKIALDTLTEEELAIYANLDPQPYGRDMAIAVAEKLLTGTSLYHAHRDYCGIGLFFYENVYTLGAVIDGYDAPYEIIGTCQTRANFVNWLAKESDQSMSRYGKKFNNQTITLSLIHI